MTELGMNSTDPMKSSSGMICRTSARETRSFFVSSGI